MINRCMWIESTFSDNVLINGKKQKTKKNHKEKHLIEDKVKSEVPSAASLSASI